LIAVGIGACFGGAAMAFVHSHRQAADATSAMQANAISVQTEAVKPQSSTAQARPVQTEAVKSQSPAATAKIPENAAPNSSLGADARRADAQVPETSPPRCNVSLCESYYQSFRASDCSYQPYSGPRQICAAK
jgi:D-alanyl-D-alanine carboxypeptidase